MAQEEVGLGLLISIFQMGKLRPRRLSELVAKVGEDPGLFTPHQMLLVLHLAAMSAFGDVSGQRG